MMLADEEIDAIANSILTDDPVSWWRRMSAKVIAANNAKVLADLKPLLLVAGEDSSGRACMAKPLKNVYSADQVSALIQDRDALAVRAKELEAHTCKQAIKDALEAAALVCDDKHDEWRFGEGEESYSAPKECADAIRKLKDQL